MTQLLGVIGDPIEHSLSPLMQQAAIDEAGLDATYRAYHVLPEELAHFVHQARKEKFLGFNVTLPHKKNILPLLDEIDQEASLIGAVNTVVQRKQQLIGYNTDGIGYLQSLNHEAHWNTADKKITLLGAGGAARAVAFALLKAKAAHLWIANRTHQHAESLAHDLLQHFPERVSISELSSHELRRCFKASDLLLNASSVGLAGTRFDKLPLEDLKTNCLVSDLVYTPRRTSLLQEAARLGHATHEGLGMLLYQGVEAFKLWFEQEPNVQVMRAALESALGTP